MPSKANGHDATPPGVGSRQVLLIPDEDGGYTVTVPSMPGCISQGDTREEALANIREAMELWIETRSSRGLDIPPADRGPIEVVRIAG